MDGRYIVGGLTLGLPAILIALTVIWFSDNPVSMLVLLSVMVFGCLYLLSYSDAFSNAATET